MELVDCGVCTRRISSIDEGTTSTRDTTAVVARLFSQSSKGGPIGLTLFAVSAKYHPCDSFGSVRGLLRLTYFAAPPTWIDTNIDCVHRRFIIYPCFPLPFLFPVSGLHSISTFPSNSAYYLLPN